MPVICDCGQDLEHLSGNSRDYAQCLKCTWSAAGPAAEHAGHHHWLDKRHTWILTPYRREP